MAKVMVLGAGSFGTALALLCHRCGHEVTVWSHREEEANRLREEREQKKLLPVSSCRQQIALHFILATGGSTGPVDSGSAVLCSAPDRPPALSAPAIKSDCGVCGKRFGAGKLPRFFDSALAGNPTVRQCGFVGTVPCRGGQPRRGDHSGGFLQGQGGSAQGAGLADEPILPRVCQR